MNKKRYKILMLITLYFIFYNFDVVYCASWPMFRGNIAREGSLYEVLYPSQTAYGWNFNVQAEIIGSPVTKGSVVYFGSRDGSVWALDGLTGEVLWQYSTSGYVDSTPVLYEQFLYITSRDGKIYCFKQDYSETEDCIPVWTYDTGSRTYSSPIVVDGMIIFVSGIKDTGQTDGYLYILNYSNGNIIKKYNLGAFSSTSVSYENGKIYYATSDGTVGCYNISTNSLLWTRKSLSSFNYSAISNKNNVVYYYAGDMDRRVYALNGDNGYILWTSTYLSKVATDKTSATDNTSVSLFDDKIFVNVYPTSVWEVSSQVVNSSQTIFCLDISGKILWKKDFHVNSSPKNSFGLVSSPAVINNIMYFGSLNGRLYAVEINSGNIVAEYNFGSAIVCSPAISNGWIYFGTVDGKFYGIKGDKILAIETPDNNDVVINNVVVKVMSSKFENEIYELKYSADGNTWINITTGTLITGTTTIIDWNTGSLVDGNYKLKQVVYNSTQNFAMNNIIIDNSPFPPTNVTAINYAKNKVYLSWTKSIDDGNGNNDVKGYEIYRSTTLLLSFDKIVSLSNGVENYLDELSQVNTYYYKLFAVDKRSKSIPTKVLSVYVSESFYVQPQSTGNITPQKGGNTKLDLGNGKSVEIIVPPNSVEKNVDVIISVVSQYNNNLPQNSQGTSMVYKIEFSEDITLKNPAEIKIIYNDTDVLNLDKQKLRIFWYDEKNVLWRLLDSSVSDTQNNLIKANIYTGGIFRVVEYSSPIDDILKDEYVYTFPSPAKGDEINFKFIIYQPATVRVYVYNVAGEIVWYSREYEYGVGDVGKTQIIPWNIKKIASGMYLFRIEAKNNKKIKRVVKKLAIIH